MDAEQSCRTEKSSAVSAVSAFSISDAAVTAFSPTSAVDVPSGKVIRIKGSFEARNRLHHSMNNEFSTSSEETSD